mmetsp:Transcript_11039/g.41223  ORF Transcript_11039/g.41223 Transcript_11039/m.41223 type:complete len:207 (-) Transcript_11039:289-909(-)
MPPPQRGSLLGSFPSAGACGSSIDSGRTSSTRQFCGRRPADCLARRCDTSGSSSPSGAREPVRSRRSGSVPRRRLTSAPSVVGTDAADSSTARRRHLPSHLAYRALLPTPQTPRTARLRTWRRIRRGGHVAGQKLLQGLVLLSPLRWGQQRVPSGPPRAVGLVSRLRQACQPVLRTSRRLQRRSSAHLGGCPPGVGHPRRFRRSIA